MPSIASDYVTVTVTLLRFMHSGGALSLLLPVCCILIYPLYLFSFISFSKILYLCADLPCGLHLRMIDCL
jgi:hypothetical protein